MGPNSKTGMVYLTPMERRTFLTGAAAPLVAGIADRLSAQTPAPKGRVKQSVMASVWTGSTTTFEERCKILARIGFKGVDLPTAQQGRALAAVDSGRWMVEPRSATLESLNTPFRPP